MEPSMSKHTPGPWMALGVDLYQYWTVVTGWVNIEDSMGDGFRQVGDGIANVYGGDRCEANAVLIAAAPDMLYQLKQVESQLSRGEPFPPAAIVAIRAAISKAEGGAK